MNVVIFVLEDVDMKIKKKVKIIVISIVAAFAANYFLYLYNFVVLLSIVSSFFIHFVLG